MKHLKKFNESSDNDLAPKYVLKTFYDRIKDSIDKDEDYEPYMRNLLKINGRIPDDIQGLINNITKDTSNEYLTDNELLDNNSCGECWIEDSSDNWAEFGCEDCRNDGKRFYRYEIDEYDEDDEYDSEDDWDEEDEPEGE